jgi:hypothetical protein
MRSIYCCVSFFIHLMTVGLFQAKVDAVIVLFLSFTSLTLLTLCAWLKGTFPTSEAVLIYIATCFWPDCLLGDRGTPLELRKP